MARKRYPKGWVLSGKAGQCLPHCGEATYEPAEFAFIKAVDKLKSAGRKFPTLRELYRMAVAIHKQEMRI